MRTTALIVFLALLFPTNGISAASELPMVSIEENRFVDGNGRPLRLLGINRSGAEFACVQGWGIFDGPTDDASIAAMASWHVNAVRLPFNQSCWLGSPYLKPEYSGQSYRRALEDYINRLHAAGLIVILDLHWNSPGDDLATGQRMMADADNSPNLWRSVASHFIRDRGLIFDLYNEPHDIDWSCWRDGCTTNEGWRAAGMQALVDAVRSTGASQPLIVSGNGWGGDLSRWIEFQPTDPFEQIAAGFHLYNFSSCVNVSCWDQAVRPVAHSVPVVTTELGQDDCESSFVQNYMEWADDQAISYLGWTWNTWDCRSGPALISAYDGTPSRFGEGFKRHLLVLNGSHTPEPKPGSTAAPTCQSSGYWQLASDGGVFSFGSAGFYGSSANLRLNQPIVGITPTPSGFGYWMVARDGGIFSFGDASFLGSTGNISLRAPIVSLISSPAGGYWLAAEDGGIFAFGGAGFHGSTGGITLNQPIVGMSSTPTGGGYWMVARDGGVFAFGDAQFFGSTGSMALNRPIVGMASTPSGRGYWLVGSDGGIFAFGDAGFYGSTGAIALNKPIVGLGRTVTGSGYWLVASDGGIFAFGDAPFCGSLGSMALVRPIVGLAPKQ